MGGTAIYDLEFYHKENSDYCVVSPSEPIFYYVYYVTFLGPSCLILAINLIVFVLVSRVLFQRRHSHAIGKVAINADAPTITVAQVRQLAAFVLASALLHRNATRMLQLCFLMYRSLFYLTTVVCLFHPLLLAVVLWKYQGCDLYVGTVVYIMPQQTLSAWRL